MYERSESDWNRRARVDDVRRKCRLTHGLRCCLKNSCGVATLRIPLCVRSLGQTRTCSASGPCRMLYSALLFRENYHCESGRKTVVIGTWKIFEIGTNKQSMRTWNSFRDSVSDAEQSGGRSSTQRELNPGQPSRATSLDQRHLQLLRSLLPGPPIPRLHLDVQIHLFLTLPIP